MSQIDVPSLPLIRPLANTRIWNDSNDYDYDIEANEKYGGEKSSALSTTRVSEILEVYNATPRGSGSSLTFHSSPEGKGSGALPQTPFVSTALNRPHPGKKRYQPCSRHSRNPELLAAEWLLEHSPPCKDKHKSIEKETTCALDN